MPCYQILLIVDALGGKLIDGVGQSPNIILGYSIGTAGLATAGVDLDVIIAIAVGRVGILVRGARADARVAIVIVMVVTSNLNDSAAWLTGASANEATQDASSGIKDVANNVSVAGSRGVK